MFTWPVELLLLITIATSVAVFSLRGVFSKMFPSSPLLLWQFQFFQNLAVLMMLLLIFGLSGSDFSFSFFSYFWGMGLAAANLSSLWFNLKALSCGPFSYTTVIVSLSAIMPTICGRLFFDETISPVQYLGIACMILCLVLANQKNEPGPKQTIKASWIIWCLLAFICSGMLGVVQKCHQSDPVHAAQMPVLLLTCFSVSALVSGLIYGICRGRATDGQRKPFRRPAAYWLPIITGLCFAFPHTVNLFLAGQLPAVVLFPTVNLCPSVLIMLIAVVFMKERLSTAQWVGIGFGFLSAFLVSGIL